MQPGGDPSPSTQPDESIEDVDVPPESSSDSACEYEEPEIEAKEHAGRGVSTGESEEPKVEMEEHARRSPRWRVRTFLSRT